MVRHVRVWRSHSGALLRGRHVAFRPAPRQRSDQLASHETGVWHGRARSAPDMATTSPTLNPRRNWRAVRERGTLAGMRITVWFYRLFGRRLAALFILPAVAYFFATDRQGRVGSRRYLCRIRDHSEGRGIIRRSPGLREVFRHYREF